MKIRSLRASFGALDGRELSLSPHLNIIEAPNEAGKSTLAAFLRTMLYGFPARERGTLAEKNRYAPWSGTPMSGLLELKARGERIVLRRDTARANAPMANFSAVYAGTGEAVPWLSAADCGSALLGVPRAVYERSAFIHQSELAVQQDAELERRIAALISTGEESASYSEAAERLKKQLNRRRHNKTGRLSELEGQLAAARGKLFELTQLEDAQREAAARGEALVRDEQQLREELHLHELADAQERRRAAAEAAEQARLAEEKAALCTQQLREAHTPTRETIAQAQARLDALEDAAAQLREAETAQREAQRALDVFDAQKPRRSVLFFLLPILLALSLCCLLCALLLQLDTAALSAAGAGVLLAASHLFYRRREKRACRARDAQRLSLDASLTQARAAADALRTTYALSEASLSALLPNAGETPLQPYLRSALARRDTLDALERDAQQKKLRCDLISSNLPDIPGEPVQRPARSRSALEQALALLGSQRREAQRAADHAAGQMRALGGPAELRARIDALEREHAQLQEEYDALLLAQDALSRANAALQTRFSPALGRRAGELFAQMTGGRYDSVLLDRALSAAVAEHGSAAAHEAALLSRGTADQLYLAVRLAICELVLPADEPAPLVLDDALVRFDDARCAAALEVLLRESRTRQILLLTCQGREARLLAGREGVTVLTL